ncbi:hypothetical protein KKA96_03895, partial [Patescibacteria group bacterium]|nr:hypothetical protein [Patescibacteria group bacterium]
MEAISKKKFLKAVKAIFKKSLVLMTALAVIFSSFGPVFTVPSARAGVTVAAVSDTLVTGQTIASNLHLTVLGINLATGASDTLTSVKVTVSGTGFDTTDLAVLANTADSGISLWKDVNGGTDGVYDPGVDTYVSLTGAPTWT